MLPGSEHVEISQRNSFQPEHLRETPSIKFACIFGNGVGRNGICGQALMLGQGWSVTINRRGTGINHALDSTSAGGVEHIQRADGIGMIAGQRICDRTGHGTQCSLMEYVNSPAGRLHCLTVVNISFQEFNFSRDPNQVLRRPWLKLSNPRTSSPRATSAWTRFDPIKPAAPVTRYLAMDKRITGQFRC